MKKNHDKKTELTKKLTAASMEHAPRPGVYEPFFSDKEVTNLTAALMEKVMKARKLAGVPFVINSGFRTEEENKKAGGVDESAHCCGKAVDIRCTDSGSRMKIVQACIEAGVSRVGIAKTFVHVDVDDAKPQGVLWLY